MFTDNKIPKILNSKIIDITGQRFHRLLIIGFDRVENGVTFWRTRCDCGKEKTMRRSNFANNSGVKSCGCFKIESRAGYRFGRPPSPLAKKRAEEIKLRIEEGKK